MSYISKFYPLEIGENNEILRNKSEEIKGIDPEIQEFSQILETLMEEYDGIGLAAPQIGKNIRMIAITERKNELGPKDNRKKNFLKNTVMINPQILEKSEETKIEEEACLSLPGKSGKVRRNTSITISYITPEGEKITKKLNKYNARIVQHEMDHLDGILFTDKIEKKATGKKKENR